ncbi:MAG: hypothetical protein M0R51_09445 [Clostridia bacterium]|jgi:hypothetical protein|nr:hypothetical protein [Clostridia bacterium]
MKSCIIELDLKEGLFIEDNKFLITESVNPTTFVKEQAISIFETIKEDYPNAKIFDFSTRKYIKI